MKENNGSQWEIFTLVCQLLLHCSLDGSTMFVIPMEGTEVIYSPSLKFPKIWDLVLSSLRYKLHRCRKWKLKSIFSPHKQPRFLWTFYNLYNFSVKSLLNKLWEWRGWWGYWNLLNRKKKWKKNLIKVLVKEVKMCKRKWVLNCSLWNTEINTWFLFLFSFLLAMHSFWEIRKQSRKLSSLL